MSDMQVAKGKPYTSLLLASYLFLVILTVFIIPLLQLHRPIGDGDVFVHIYMTGLMASSNGIDDFYQRLSSAYTNHGGDYPIGLWVYGGVLSQITGLSPVVIGTYIPVIGIFLISLCMYILSSFLLRSKEKGIIATILLFTMPLALDFVGYFTKIFTLPFICLLVYVVLDNSHKYTIRLILFAVFSSLIIASHSGTTMVMGAFVGLYSLNYVILTGGERRVRLYGFLIVFFTLMTLASIYRPNAYTDLQLTKVEYLLEKVSFPSLATTLYSESIRQGSVGYMISLCSAYIIGLEIIYQSRTLIFRRNSILLTEGIKTLKSFSYLTPYTIIIFFLMLSASLIPTTSLTRGVYTNSIIAPVIWLGPIQTLLFLFGVQRLNRDSAILIVTFALIVFPFINLLGVGDSRTTGSVRFIFYYMVSMSIVAAEGAYNFISILKTHKRTVLLGTTVIFLSLLISLQVGVLLFKQSISETPLEKSGLKFFQEEQSGDIVFAPNMRQRIEVYSGQRDASWTTSNEEYFRLLEAYVKFDKEGIQRFRGHDIRYIIDSDRTRKYVEAEGLIKSTSYRGVDRVYDGGRFITYFVNQI